jgi:FlaA1/EpsC-like NDP-sugar epimerase
VATAVYSVVTGVSLVAAFVVRAEFHTAPLGTRMFAASLVLLVTIRLGVNYGFRLGESRWRYVGTRDLLRLLGAVTVGSLLFFLVDWTVPGIARAPRSVILLEWVFSGYMIGGIWVLYRLVYEYLRVREAPTRTRVLVVGAGEAGQQLVHQMLRSRSGLTPVGLVDDDPLRWGTMVHGVEVVGAIRDTPPIAASAEADQILIAIPSATPRQLRRVVEACEQTDLPLQILPGIEDVITGDAALTQVRNLELEDLLGREPIRFEVPELVHDLGGRSVLVTGAAGSIGSELVHQIAAYGPACLVLLDQAETPLYFLELELRRRFPKLRLIVVVGSITEEETVARVFEAYRPERVFHAAAYKHVPMMEMNAREAVRTNVRGTYLVARAVGEYGSGAFLLISSDKAVQPSSVMGATKRLAERVCMRMQALHPGVAFRAVRFGNVLGSSGSVIPVFRQQLERGEPLTVTHEEVTRYFMSIPEAVQLVLRTSTLDESRGRVSMLDMGEPVRILDLARRLLRLAGRPYRLGENVVITGLRPGEKLHEELVAPGEQACATSVERVSILELASDFSALPSFALQALEDGHIDALADFLFAEFPGVDRRARARKAASA